jgi:hypothetical protein
MNKALHRVYLTWKHPRRWIEVIFPVAWLTFPQWTGPCVRSKGMKSAMNCTLTSPDIAGHAFQNLVKPPCIKDPLEL